MTLDQCLYQCHQDPDFVAMFDRENNTNLAMRGNAMELCIYQVSGRMQADIERFVDYVYTRIWKPAVTA